MSSRPQHRTCCQDKVGVLFAVPPAAPPTSPTAPPPDVLEYCLNSSELMTPSSYTQRYSTPIDITLDNGRSTGSPAHLLPLFTGPSPSLSLQRLSGPSL